MSNPSPSHINSTQPLVSDVSTSIYTTTNDSNSETSNDNVFVSFLRNYQYYIIAGVIVIFLCIIIAICWRRRSKRNNQVEEARAKSAKIRKELSSKIDTKYSAQDSRSRNQSGISKHYQIRNPTSNTLKIGTTQSNSSNVAKSTISMSTLPNTKSEREDSLNGLDGKYRKETESHTASKLDHGDDDYYLVTMIEQNYAQSALKEDLEVMSPSATRIRGATDAEFAKVLTTISDLNDSEMNLAKNS